MNNSDKDILAQTFVDLVCASDSINKVINGKCETIDEINEILSQISDLTILANNLKRAALENKAAIASNLAESWLSNDFCHQMVDELKKFGFCATAYKLKLDLNLKTVREAVAKVRTLLFDETDGVSFKNVICIGAILYNDVSKRFLVGFSWHNQSRKYPDVNQPEVWVNIPFGNTAIIRHGKVVGGISVSIHIGPLRQIVFEDIYNLEILRNALCKSLAIGNIDELKKFIQPKTEVFSDFFYDSEINRWHAGDRYPKNDHYI